MVILLDIHAIFESVVQPSSDARGTATARASRCSQEAGTEPAACCQDCEAEASLLMLQHEPPRPQGCLASGCSARVVWALQVAIGHSACARGAHLQEVVQLRRGVLLQGFEQAHVASASVATHHGRLPARSWRAHWPIDRAWWCAPPVLQPAGSRALVSDIISKSMDHC